MVKDKNKSTSKILNQVNRTYTSGRIPKVKQRKYSVLVLCVLSVVLSFLFWHQSHTYRVNSHILQVNSLLLNELQTDVYSFFRGEKKALLAIERQIDKSVFCELYTLALFYYRTRQYKQAFSLTEFGLEHYAGKERKRFDLLRWLLENSGDEVVPDVKQGYVVAGDCPKNLQLLLIYAMERGEHLLQKNICRKLRKLYESQETFVANSR